MTWTRRGFVAGLSFAGLAAACKQAASKDMPGGPAPKPAKPAPPPQRTPEPLNPGYEAAGRVDDTYDGDELLQLTDRVVIRRDAKLAERSRIPLNNVESFALLPDRSLVVVTLDESGSFAHHVVKDKVVGKQVAYGVHVRAATNPKEFWTILSSGYVARTKLGAQKITPGIALPENCDLSTPETQADGSLVIANLYGILHVDKAVTTYKWDDQPKILCRGPKPMTVWANLGGDKLVLLQLAGDKATATATFAMPKSDHLIHLTSNGSLAAGIVAHAVTPTTSSFSLVVWEAAKERFRVALDDAPHVGRVAVMSAKRVAALAQAPGVMRAFDLATGKPV